MFFFIIFFSDCKFKVKKSTHNASLVKNRRRKKKHISAIYGELSTFVKWPFGKFMCTDEPKIKESFTGKKHFLTSEFFFFFLIQPDENKV